MQVLLHSADLEKHAKGGVAGITFRIGRRKSKRRGEQGKPRGKGPWALRPAGGRVLHLTGHSPKSYWGAGWRELMILNLMIESEQRR